MRCLPAKNFMRNVRTPIHLAHREPSERFYPMLVSLPDSIRGVDCCLFYLNTLWLENRIMAAMDEKDLEQLWNRLPPDTLNQCEPLILNGIGKAVISPCLDKLTFDEMDYASLGAVLRGKTPESIHEQLKSAAQRSCERLALTDANAAACVKTAVPQLQMRLEGALPQNRLFCIFV